jgi:hypothetical protein
MSFKKVEDLEDFLKTKEDLKRRSIEAKIGEKLKEEEYAKAAAPITSVLSSILPEISGIKEAQIRKPVMRTLEYVRKGLIEAGLDRDSIFQIMDEIQRGVVSSRGVYENLIPSLYTRDYRIDLIDKFLAELGEIEPEADIVKEEIIPAYVRERKTYIKDQVEEHYGDPLYATLFEDLAEEEQALDDYIVDKVDIKDRTPHNKRLLDAYLKRKEREEFLGKSKAKEFKFKIFPSTSEESGEEFFSREEREIPLSEEREEEIKEEISADLQQAKKIFDTRLWLLERAGTKQAKRKARKETVRSFPLQKRDFIEKQLEQSGRAIRIFHGTGAYDQMVKRLDLIFGSMKAGNNSREMINEGSAIIDALREADIIDDSMKKIMLEKLF